MNEERYLKSINRRGFVTMAGGLIAAKLYPTSAVAATEHPPHNQPVTHYKTADLNGLEIFYREAGPKGAPVVLLLHGFPTSSRMFRNLIPLLADRYHVIAPDYPGFGHSAVPSRESFQYSHKRFSEIIDALLTKLEIERFAMYLMDFGGPIGYRLMLNYPDRVTGVVVQNTPVFSEPISGPVWGPLLAYWKDASQKNRDAIRPMLTAEAIRTQYIAGTRDPSLIDPDNWLIDSALIARPGVDEIMLDLLYDIHSNKPVVAAAVDHFRSNQHRILIATGANDPLFPGVGMKPPAAMPDIDFYPVDSGHFALEDRCQEIANVTCQFLTRVMPG